MHQPRVCSNAAISGIWGHAARAATVAAAAAVWAGPARAGERTTPWSFGGIGASQTLVRIVTLGGPCEPPLAPVVRETTDAVRITARNDVPDDPRPCPAILAFVPRYVRLAAPLAGRKLLGAKPDAVPPFPADGAPAPHVVGLAPGDALTVLRAAHFKPVVVRRTAAPGLRRVVAQQGERLVIGGGA